MNFSFPLTSRYYNVDTAVFADADGNQIVYLQRRFLPDPDTFALLQEHVITQGERVDQIAAQYLGDPEQFWRLCDSNGVLYPEQLVETIGKHVRITLPQGIPGTPNA